MAMKIDSKSAMTATEEETLEKIENDLSVLRITSDNLPQEQQAVLEVIQRYAVFLFYQPLSL
jgi:hypothetical protein